jgi:hypothetical protein
MSQIELVIDADSKPVNLLDPEAIVQQCRDAAQSSDANNLRGIPLVDKSRGAPYAWVKYGRSITMSEALTQDFVGQTVNGKADTAVCVPSVYLAFRSGNYGYIAMEYIDGSICDDSDAKLVAAAVQSLITIRGPTAEPGPVGGGPITHRFFVEWKSPMTYHSVQELEQHINGVSVFLFVSPCPSGTFAGFWMTTLGTDSRVHGQGQCRSCRLRARGRGTRPAPLPL